MFLLRYTDWSVVLKVILTMFLSFSIICLVVTIMIYISLWGLFQQESIRFPFQHKRAFIVLNIAFNAIIVKILWIIKLFFQGMQVSDSRQNITLTALILLFEVLVYLWCFVLQLLRFFLHKYHVFAAKYDVFKMGVTFMVTNLSGIAITGIAIIIGYYEQNKKLYSDVFLNSSKILICVVYIYYFGDRLNICCSICDLFSNAFCNCRDANRLFMEGSLWSCLEERELQKYCYFNINPHIFVGH